MMSVRNSSRFESFRLTHPLLQVVLTVSNRNFRLEAKPHTTCTTLKSQFIRDKQAAADRSSSRAKYLRNHKLHSCHFVHASCRRFRPTDYEVPACSLPRAS